MNPRIVLLAGLAIPPFSSAIADTATARIVGGESAPVDRWPWMAQIVVDDPQKSGFLLCGASHLSPDWVITAAHCMKDESGDAATSSEIQVFIGDQDRNSPASQGIQVQQILIHSQNNDLGIDRDLALLRIDPHSNTRWPSIIDEQRFNALEKRSTTELDESVTTLGWGDTGDGTLSDVLQEVQLDYIPQQQCREISNLTISDFAVCAAELNPIDGNNQDTCFGDSGGPLFLDRDPQPWLVGLTSFGLSDCATGAPSGYTHLFAETPELESLTDSVSLPLVDLLPRWQGETPKYYYQPPNGSQTLSLALVNNSHQNTVTDPVLRFSLQGESTASGNWPGCGSLLSGNSCRPTASIEAAGSVSQDFVLDGNGGADQVVTAVITATSDQDDYRRRNNRITQTVVFSDNPDLALSATQQNSDGLRATVAVTLSNRSPLNIATGGEIAFPLPPNTRLDNESALGCIAGNPVRCPVGELATQSEKTLLLELVSGDGIDQSVTFTGSANQDDVPDDGDRFATLTVSYTAPATTGFGSSGGGGAGIFLSLLATLLLARRHQP